MSDSERNTNQQRLAVGRRQARQPPMRRPPNVNENHWKNRHQVSAKLTEVNYLSLRSWLVTNNLNFNSGLNRLIHTHPEIIKQND